VQRYVWQSAFGPMPIQVHDGAVFVNGGRVTSPNKLRTGNESVSPVGPA
jgi:hypothetical protein